MLGLFQETLNKWLRASSIIVSIFIGLSVGIITNSISHILPNTLLFLTSLKISIAFALFSAGITYWIFWCLSKSIINKRIDVAIELRRLGLFERFGDAIGGFLFFVQSSNFEKTLDWFREASTWRIKCLIAKVIHQQLNRSFQKEAVIINIPTYAEYSNILKDLLKDVEDVYFTCIKSPKNWFEALDDISYEHETLPKKYRPNKDYRYNSNNLSISDERKDKYPVHYIRFLEKPSDQAKRRRVFLLNNKEWNSLIETNNYDYYKKFVGPCIKANIATLFVNIKEFSKKIVHSEDNIRIPMTNAIEHNITKSDYTVFENYAVMVYKESRYRKNGKFNSSPNLHFKIEPHGSSYAEFLNILFDSENNIDCNYGVLNPQQVEQIINDQTVA